MMRSGCHDPTYCIAPGIRWIVEEHGVLVIDELARQSAVLCYPEAAVWELLLRGHSLAEMVRMFSHIAGITEDHAQRDVVKFIDRWRQCGWLADS